MSNNVLNPALPLGKTCDELGLLLEVLKFVENVNFLIFDIRVSQFLLLSKKPVFLHSGHFFFFLAKNDTVIEMWK